ncbi:MAG: PD-(D/E)XK nuclease family protein [Campylobacterales bacterium]
MAQLRHPLLLFPTRREIRHYWERIRREGGSRVLPQLMPIGEFFDRLTLVPGYRFVTPSLQRYYLYRAVEGVEVEKLGLPTSFLQFFRNAHLLEGFYSELFLDGVNWEEFKRVGWQLVQQADIYEEFGEHLRILEEIYKNYRELLHRHRLTDRFLIPEEEWHFPLEWLSQFSKIEIKLEGYLKRFELQLLRELPIPVEVEFKLTRFNRPLIRKMFGEIGEGEEGVYRLDFHRGKILNYQPLKKPGKGLLIPVSHRYQQIEVVFGGLLELERRGFRPEELVVILPDESAKELLWEWDRHRNLNFAMGWRLEETHLFYRLEQLARGEEGPELEMWWEQFNRLSSVENLKEWVEGLFLGEEGPFWAGLNREQLREKGLEALLLWERVGGGDLREFLWFLLEEIRGVQIDDIYGGRVTVMGILESRGAPFKGGVLLDFNEGVVPRVQQEDYFLNTFTRKLLGLPTREEKEALQKSFYYNLLLEGEQFYFSYLESDQEGVSRFRYQLPLEEGKVRFSLFRRRHRLTPPKLEIKIPKPKKLSPTLFKTFVECPTKYYFHYIEEIKPPPTQQEQFGTLFHRKVAEVLDLYRSQKLELGGWEGYFREVWGRLIGDVPEWMGFEWEGWWKEKIKYFCQRDWPRVEGRDFLVEVEFKGVKVEGVELEGRGDRLEKGRIVVDYKTGKYLNKSNFFKELLEMTIPEWNPKEFSELSIQGSFYLLLGEGRYQPLFWDIFNKQEITQFTPFPVEEFLKKWPSKPPLRSPNPGKEPCKYCPYLFLCSQTQIT